MVVRSVNPLSRYFLANCLLLPPVLPKRKKDKYWEVKKQNNFDVVLLLLYKIVNFYTNPPFENWPIDEWNTITLHKLRKREKEKVLPLFLCVVVSFWLLPGPSRRLASVIKCRRFHGTIMLILYAQKMSLSCSNGILLCSITINIKISNVQMKKDHSNGFYNRFLRVLIETDTKQCGVKSHHQQIQRLLYCRIKEASM